MQSIFCPLTQVVPPVALPKGPTPQIRPPVLDGDAPGGQESLPHQAFAH